MVSINATCLRGGHDEQINPTPSPSPTQQEENELEKV